MTSTKPCSCHSDDSPETIGKPVVEGPLVRSVFRIPGMDCPSEEQMIRLRLGDMPIVSMEFDLPARSLVICHGGEVSDILSRLEPLDYGTELVESSPLDPGDLNQLVKKTKRRPCGYCWRSIW